MIARTLRSGQSLGFGFNMVSTEMPAPIGKEFGRVFEEQNLGIPLDDSLRSMTERIPNLDLKFFVTALILQRQTGGDLAEILDKIGELIRDRFRIWGQIQALTGEGRLSGIVLLALPFCLVDRGLQTQSRLHHASVPRPDGHEDAGRGRHHAGLRRAGDPQNRQHQGVARRCLQKAWSVSRASCRWRCSAPSPRWHGGGST